MSTRTRKKVREEYYEEEFDELDLEALSSEELEQILFDETSTFGVRRRVMERSKRARREHRDHIISHVVFRIACHEPAERQFRNVIFRMEKGAVERIFRPTDMKGRIAALDGDAAIGHGHGAVVIPETDGDGQIGHILFRFLSFNVRHGPHLCPKLLPRHGRFPV